MAEFSFVPFESFHGGVARWAAEVGGLERMSELTSVAGVQYGHRQNSAFSTPAEIRALAELMAVDADDLISRATPRIGGDDESVGLHHCFFGTTVPTYLLEKRYRRFSPGALAASLADKDIKAAYDRAVWHIRLFPFDIETWEFLLDRCPRPDCRGRPGWQHTLGIDNCEHCMKDLKTAPTTKVPEQLRPRLELAIGLVHPDPVRRAATIAALPPALAEAGAPATLDLLMRLIPVVDPSIAPQIVDYLRAPQVQLATATADAWKIVAGWPDAMNVMISKRIATRTARHSDGNGARTLRFASVRRIADMPDAVRDIVTKWRDTINLQGPNGTHLLETTRSITDVAEAIGLGSAIVADIRRSGALRTVLVLDQNRAEPRFLKSEFDDLERRHAVRTSIDTARRPLGVSSHGVEQLVAMRLLDRETHPYFAARYGAMQIVRPSIIALGNRVVGAVTGNPEHCTLSLHSAMKAVGKRMKPWGPAFAALIDGTLPFVVDDKPGPLSRRIFVDPSFVDFVRALRFDPRDPNHLQLLYAEFISKIEAAETLNIGFSKSTPLLSAIKTATGTREKLVPVHYVLKLADIHISSTELGARRGVPPQRAYRDAIDAKIQELGPGGFCRKTAEDHFFGAGAAADAEPAKQGAFL